MASSLAYGYSFTAFESSGKPSFYALFVYRNVKLQLLIYSFQTFQSVADFLLAGGERIFWLYAHGISKVF